MVAFNVENPISRTGAVLQQQDINSSQNPSPNNDLPDKAAHIEHGKSDDKDNIDAKTIDDAQSCSLEYVHGSDN